MFTLNCHGKLIFVEKPVVMGILNITSDSFYAGSRLSETDALLEKAGQMIAEGAFILDVGAQSSRPGSSRLSEEEEIKKAVPAIKAIKDHFPEILVSIDTYQSRVAEESVLAGADMVNDISAGVMDHRMIETVASLRVPYIAMHMKGVPETMQTDTHYDNILKDVLDYFIRKTDECLQAGIHDVMIDPGFGFGKTISQNLYLLKNLDLFAMLEKPVLAGLSRKSTIYKTLGTTPEEALNGTTVLNTIALQKGASILRVHDVKEAVETIKLMEAYNQASL